MGKKRFEKKISKLYKDFEQDINELDKKYASLLEDMILNICMSSVDEFYDSYEPSSYDRYGDAFNAYKVIVNLDNDYFEVLFDSKYMKHKHRADNDYIYNLIFKKGVHGGAVPKNDLFDYMHNPIKNGSFYWRTPFNNFKNWYKPAASSFPVYIEIKEILESELELLFEKKQSEVSKMKEKFLDEFYTLYYEED